MKDLLELKLTLLASIVFILLATTSQHIYAQETKQSIMETLSTDTAYIKDRFDIENFEKQGGALGGTQIFTDQNGYEIRITKSVYHMFGNPEGPFTDYNVVTYPPRKYYFIYQKYNSEGNIQQRGINYFGVLNIGEFEFYDADGNKKVEIYELPPNRFTLNDVYAFMEKKGWVDDKAKNRNFLVVTTDPEKKGNWKITIDDTKRYYRIDYELHRDTGSVIQKSEGYYTPVL